MMSERALIPLLSDDTPTLCTPFHPKQENSTIVKLNFWHSKFWRCYNAIVDHTKLPTRVLVLALAMEKVQNKHHV